MRVYYLEKLLHDYPKMFGRITAVEMNDFILCEEGWFTLLDTALAEIQNHVEEARRNQVRYKWRMRQVRKAYNTCTLDLFAAKCKMTAAEKNTFLQSPFSYYVKPEFCPPFWLAIVRKRHGQMQISGLGGDEYCRGVIALAERMSGIVCDQCGRVKGEFDCICRNHAA